MSFTLGMSAPINVADYREFLHPGQWRDDLPKGQGATPVNLLCRELLRRGQPLVIFSCDAAVEDEIVLEGPLLRLCLGPKGRRPARDFFRTERAYLARAIAREQPDRIHAQWTYEYAMPVQNTRIPHVITAHDTPLRYLWHNFIPYRMARTLMAYRVIARARHIVSVSPYVTQHLHRYMLYRGPGTVIPNGLPESAFITMAPPSQKTDRLTLATILVGWGNYKNGAVAVKAFARLRERRPELRLLMFGGGHGPGEEAEAWARAHGLADGIEFVGQMPYPDLMRRLEDEVDVVVNPALVETHSMALIEAMARRIPVVGGARSGAVPWTLAFGEAGLLADIRSPDSVAEALGRYLDSPALRQEFGERGQRLTRERFHIGAVADAWQQIYAELK